MVKIRLDLTVKKESLQILNKKARELAISKSEIVDSLIQEKWPTCKNFFEKKREKCQLL